MRLPVPGYFSSSAVSRAPHTSPISTIPRRSPSSPTTGRCRNRPLSMVRAASGMLVDVLITVGPMVIRSWMRTSFRSLPSATAYDVGLGDEALGPLAFLVVHHDEGGRPRVPHQVGGR